MRDVQIWCDGACWPNPGGPGGFAAIIIQGKNRMEVSQGFCSTTVNRMELMAPIVGLGVLEEKSHVTIYTDSQYVAHSVSKGWMYRWKENRWRGADGLPVKNLDLWKILDQYLDFHDVTFAWVRGHTGIPENERCDVLAGEGKKNPTYRDAGFLEMQA